MFLNCFGSSIFIFLFSISSTYTFTPILEVNRTCRGIRYIMNIVFKSPLLSLSCLLTSSTLHLLLLSSSSFSFFTPSFSSFFSSFLPSSSLHLLLLSSSSLSSFTPSFSSSFSSFLPSSSLHLLLLSSSSSSSFTPPFFLLLLYIYSSFLPPPSLHLLLLSSFFIYSFTPPFFSFTLFTPSHLLLCSSSISFLPPSLPLLHFFSQYSQLFASPLTKSTIGPKPETYLVRS